MENKYKCLRFYIKITYEITLIKMLNSNENIISKINHLELKYTF